MSRTVLGALRALFRRHRVYNDKHSDAYYNWHFSIMLGSQALLIPREISCSAMRYSRR